ncbi:hypothetical protein [Enterococcus cecorum]|uniref:hypothetical protein n=1 Tax=Enterococcus cecorum TaxID=44008 RepID=UPI003264A88A
MPTAEYIKAVNLLNSKCEKNWGIAIDLCTESERNFIREAVGASNYEASDAVRVTTFKKSSSGGLYRNGNIFRIHPQYSDMLVSTTGQIYLILKKLEENPANAIYRIKRLERSKYRSETRTSIVYLGTCLMVNYLVYDTFVGREDKKGKVINIDGNIRNCRLSNLKIETPLDKFKRSELYEHLDKIIEMRKRKITFEKMSDILGVNVPALKHFVQKAKKLGVID